MSTTRIQASYEDLSDLAARIRILVRDLDGDNLFTEAETACLESRKIQKALSAFSGRWKNTRGELTKQLQVAAEFLDKAVADFREADRLQASTLTTNSAPPATEDSLA